MPTVSVTRLHLRSWRFFPGFLLHTLTSGRQATRSGGFRGGFLAGDSQRGYWTVTVWDDIADMRAFRNTGRHLAAMSRLVRWCDEASFVHWDVEAAAVPSTDEAYARLRDRGTTSKVRHPSPTHRAGLTVGTVPPRRSLELRPADPNARAPVTR